MGQHEPYWQTNTSFSPPPSRWDFSFPSDELLYDSRDITLLHRSSASSNSKESRWMRDNHLYNSQCFASGGAGLRLTSSLELAPGPQWTPPVIQEINTDDYETAKRRGQVLLHSSPSIAGPSGHPESGGSTPTFSDSSEDEPTFKSCLSSHCNFSGRRSFLSKPIHPLFFPVQAPKEASETPSARLSEFDAATVQRDARHWSSASSSADSSDISEPLESEIVGRLCISSDGFKCGLCERFLSQRSPWSSRRIVRSGDMPVAGVLSCCHVFHAECLEQTTPKAHKNDPPCPLCVGLEDENSAVLRVFPGLRDRFPNSKTSSEYGPSGPRGCVTMGDFVGGALHSPHRNTTLLLNGNRMRKNLSLKGNFSKEFPGKLRKNGSYSSQLLNGNAVDFGTVGCSKMTRSPSMKRLH